MNNNLINFINGKMNRLQKRISNVQYEVSLLDTALYSSEVRKALSEEEKYKLIITFINKEHEYENLKSQYKSLNIIRMSLLGLI